MNRLMISLLVLWGVLAQVPARAQQGPPPAQPRPTCKISNVHTISVNLNPERTVPQADDNGVILR